MPIRKRITDTLQDILHQCKYRVDGSKNKKVMEEKFELAIQEWQSDHSQKQAEDLLSNQDKLEDFLQDIEKKLSHLPFGADKFSAIPGMISMLRSYIRRDYTRLPKSSILAVLAALIYFFSPLDIVPDFFLGPGLLDDAFIINTCLKLIKSDVMAYRKWQASQWKVEE